MRVALVGADFEENLGIGMVAACAEAAGHSVEIVPFNTNAETPRIVRRIIELAPHVVGLSIQFQHRAYEFLGLARMLRTAGYGGHITCGGQFPTLAYEQVLRQNASVDSIVLHEGEQSFVDVLGALATARPLAEIPGLAVRNGDGAPTRTPPRPLLKDLDQLPFTTRYRQHVLHAGIPFIPIMGGRGCWGSCAFCSITSFYRDARNYGGAQLLRHRSPEDIAEEMALLSHNAGGNAIFCFHDDNFLLPKPEASIARVRAIRAALDDYGVGDVAIIGKCRPDSLTPELAQSLRELGVIRLYVGVENVSDAGSEHLGRGVQTACVSRALAACREAGIFVCYNLLMFEPGATLNDIEQNVRFIREHADHPVNFCRAEPYHGTPLQLSLASDDSISGSYLGYDYRIADDKAELLFRVSAAAFRQRNFASNGVHNRYMGVGYRAKLLEHFYPANRRRDELIAEGARLTRGIALETAEFLTEALRFVRDVDLNDRDRIERETALLGLRIAEADRLWHAQLDTLRNEIQRFTDDAPPPVQPKPTAKLLKLAKHLALGGFIAGAPVACSDDSTVDPVPQDASIDQMAPDPVPQDASVDQIVVDPPPPDSGVENDLTVVDMLPPDAGVDQMVSDPLPPDSGVDATGTPSAANTPQLIDKWTDTTPKRAVRSQDLPLYDAPVIKLSAVRDGDQIRVLLEGGPEAISTRWQSDGQIEGDGREVQWRPDSTSDQICVGVRSKGGVAVVALRASDVG